MPLRAVWKTRPSGVVPHRLRWAAEQGEEFGRDGDDAGLGDGHVTPHWAVVEGRAILVGLDIRSFAEPWIEDPAHHHGGYEGPREPVDSTLVLPR